MKLTISLGRRRFPPQQPRRDPSPSVSQAIPPNTVLDGIVGTLKPN